jgi:hypothetical protein
MATTKTSIFAKAKDAAPKTTGAKTKEKVVVQVDLGTKLTELQETREQIAVLEAKEAMLSGDIKPVANDAFLKLMKANRARPDSFIMESEEGKILVIIQDRYLKVTEAKEKTLAEYNLSGLIEEKTTFSFNPVLLEKYEAQISDAISKMKIPDDDKAAMIEAKVEKAIKKGTLDTLPTYENPELVFTLIEAVVQLKNQ